MICFIILSKHEKKIIIPLPRNVVITINGHTSKYGAKHDLSGEISHIEGSIK